MTANAFPNIIPALAVLIGSYIATWIVRSLAQKVGWVSRPVSYRWSQRTVALGGGIAIHSSLIFAILWIGKPYTYTLLPPFLVLLLLGLLDDLRGVMPREKLLIQFLAAVWAIAGGFSFASDLFSYAITLIWIIGITNALNIIDNMDGLAAGITAIAAFGMACLFLQAGNLLPASLALLLSMACLGFLVHNYNPAKIFMGDTGSLPLGFLLAVLATQIKTHPAGELGWGLGLLAAIGFLLMPLFDMCLVIVSRRREGKSVMTGGRDHSSHRLAKLGLSEKNAVIILYLLQFIGVSFASAIGVFSSITILVFALILSLLLLVLGLFLLGIPIDQAKRTRLETSLRMEN